MTSNNPPHGPRAKAAGIVAADALDLAALIRDGALDVVPGHPPVPINVWRVADLELGQDLSKGMSPSLAAIVVGLYTEPRDTLVDFDADPTLAGVAGAGGCRYLPVRGRSNLADLDPVAGKAKLITLRWPTAARPGRDGPGEDEMDSMFAACAALLAPDGCTVVALAPPPPDKPHVEYAHQLVPAAHRAGLGYLQHIVAVGAPIRGERPTNLSAPASHATLRAAARTVRHLRIHVDLLLFVLRGTPAGSAEPADYQGKHRRGSRGGRRRTPRSPR